MNLKKFNKHLKKEYNETFSEKKYIYEKKFQFKLRYVFACILILFGVIFIADHISVTIYNQKIKQRESEILDLNHKELSPITSEKELKRKMNTVDLTKKKSLMQQIFSMRLSCSGSMKSSDANMAPGDAMAENPSADPDGSMNSYDTNLQTKGVDEADTAKCDGTYIYALLNNKLYIYNLSGVILSSTFVSASEIYVYKDKVVCLGRSATSIYTFDETLTLDYRVEYAELVDSRKINNELYITSRKTYNMKTIDYSNLYFDGSINPKYIYSFIKYDLDSKTIKNIDILNASGACLYASESNFYLASNNYINGKKVTIVSIITTSLEPKGVIKVEGSVLNQFSMDEYNGYFRIVTTDTLKKEDELNHLSIYNVETLEYVGGITKGIGKANQIIKSVRFDKNICYAVTYLNFDPLYEIDCSNPSEPKIISQYEAPGYSNYLHSFNIKDKEYLFGLGVDDYGQIKLSIYKNEETTTQMGKDLLIIEDYRIINPTDSFTYFVSGLRTPSAITNNHKALFVFNDSTYFYLGVMIGYRQYTIFKIDVEDSLCPVSVYKEYKDIDTDSSKVRGFLVEGKFYIPTPTELFIDTWQ